MCGLVFPTFGVHPVNDPEYANRLDDLSKANEQSPMIREIGRYNHFIQDTSTCQPKGR